MRRVLALPVVVAVLGLAGCGGSDVRPPAGDGARQLSPAAFQRAVAAPGTVTIDVHVPYIGELAGTDAFIPYTRIARAALPARSTRLALYCRSGRMSAIAARQLRAMGHRDLVELHGGMEAWTASGRALLQRPGRPSA